jgi:hypothetical protein
MPIRRLTKADAEALRHTEPKLGDFRDQATASSDAGRGRRPRDPAIDHGDREHGKEEPWAGFYGSPKGADQKPDEIALKK